MNKINLIFAVSMVVVVLSLAGVTVYQQLEISNLYGQNRELAVSNLQKDEEKEDLRSNYEEQISSLRNSLSQLNSTYLQTLNTLYTLTTLLNTSETNLSTLRQDYSSLNASYTELYSLIEKFSEEYNGTSGVFVLSYRITYGASDFYGNRDYILTVSFFNFLEPANVTMQFYNTDAPLIGHIHNFDFSLVSGRNDFVVGWYEKATEHEHYRLLVSRG